MTAKELDPFNYFDIKSIDYKSKQQFLLDLEEISKNLENVSEDWKKRQSSLKKIGSISKSNYGKSDTFIKYFNEKLCLNLEIQLKDPRSSIVKETCIIISLCARNLGILIEHGTSYLLSQYILFKIAGSANKIISDLASKCILNIVRYINSVKIIINIVEQKTTKSNTVKIIIAESLVNIFCYYDDEYIIKTKEILEETISILIIDANCEVRATTRKAFILYKSRFNDNAEIIFKEFGKNVKNQIKEDEKKFDKNQIHIINKENIDLLKYDNKGASEKSTQKTKPKTPDMYHIQKKKPKPIEVNKENVNKTNFKRLNLNKKENNMITSSENDNDSIINNDDDELDIENIDLEIQKPKKLIEEQKQVISNLTYIPKNNKIKKKNLIATLKSIKLNNSVRKASKFIEVKNNVINLNNTDPNDNLTKISEKNERIKYNKIIEIKKNKKFKHSYSSEKHKINNNILSNKTSNSNSNITTGRTSGDFHIQGSINNKRNIIANNFEIIKISKKNKEMYSISPKIKKRQNIINNNFIQNQNFSCNNYQIEDISNYTESMVTKMLSQNNDKNNKKINISEIKNEINENKNLSKSINNYIYSSVDYNDENENKINNEDRDIFCKTMEGKLKMSVDKLDNLMDPKEKLIIFQYLFNNFSEIMNDYNQKKINQNTLKKYVSIHVDNLKEKDNLLLEQIIKNLMRMVFYMQQIFDFYKIENILKFILFSLCDNNDDTLIKLSNELLAIIRKKFDNEEIFKTLYGLLKENNSNQDKCYEFMSLLIPECNSILSNINYFKQVFRLICLTEVESNKIGKIIDILYRKYPSNFIQAFNGEVEPNQHKILYFMEKSNSFYFRQFESECQKNEERKMLNIIDETQEDKNENQENQEILKDDQIKEDLIFIDDTKNNLNRKNDSNNIISNQNESNIDQNNKQNSINLNLINNSKKQKTQYSEYSNNINYNSLIKEPIPNEVKTAIENNNSELFLDYINKHNNYIPNFFILLTNKKYSDIKNISILLFFTENLLITKNLINENNSYMELIIKQLVSLLTAFKNEKNIINTTAKLLTEIPILLNAEKYFKSINKYLKLDTDVFILENLLQIIKDYIIKSKNVGINNLISSSIDKIFNLLNHQNSEIRKRAVYCCVEIYLVIGKEFENYTNNIPKAQQNLVRLYIKKRTG